MVQLAAPSDLPRLYSCLKISSALSAPKYLITLAAQSYNILSNPMPASCEGCRGLQIKEGTEGLHWQRVNVQEHHLRSTPRHYYYHQYYYCYYYVVTIIIIIIIIAITIFNIQNIVTIIFLLICIFILIITSIFNCYSYYHHYYELPSP